MDEDRVQLEHRLTKVEEAVSFLPTLIEKLDHMDERFARYEGRWGTITLIGAALWAMLITFKDEIFGWIKH